MFLFDARALQGPQPTGVGHYTKLIAQHLQKTAIAPQLAYLQTGLETNTKLTPSKQTHTVNIPNKLLNLSLAVLKKPVLSNISNVPETKLLFLPNINFISGKTPYVLTIHDLSFIHSPHWYSLKMRIWHKAVHPEKLIKNAAHIIAVSDATKADCMRTFNIPEHKITRIYPGIKPITCTHPPLIKNPYILTMGAVEPRKNLTLLFQAFKELKKNSQHKKLKLIIAGPLGHKGSEILKTAHSYHIQNDVTYMGYVSPQTKNNLLTHASVFVYPSLFEGFGFPPLEAMMARTPVVASWTTSLKEVLGSHALLTHPHKHSELSTAIHALLTQPELRQELVESAYTHAQTFTWRHCAQQTANTLTTAVCT